MKKKQTLTAEQLYKKNQTKSKVFKNIAPIIFWLFISFSILFTILMIRNSVGNITEIIDMLDKKTLTGEELEQNYGYLVNKYGEWVIVGKNAGSFNVRFIDIRKAFFSGLMITYLSLAITFFLVAIIFGKFVFPKLAQYYSENNQDMVNIATLQTNVEITQRKNKGDWF